ncbi:Lanthionine synthetase C-like protein [Ascobolus immersus RN42]|uniref:Lanthionine synthetase C-like protein n=1 Tax=Ascobolus immersus RN42 TaxID=1160509 RepID=A0A3N4I758_ASCIM|nr:Lanthionine synthetase C-like protein [Ascobolus immersus RN42]
MSHHSSPKRYHDHQLEPAQLDAAGQKKTLSALQRSIRKGINFIEESDRMKGKNFSDRHDSLYTGESGISLMYLRIFLQAKALDMPDKEISYLAERVRLHMPRLSEHSPPAGRLSPIGGPTGPAVVEVLRQLLLVDPNEDADDLKDRWKTAMKTLKNATNNSLQTDVDQVDEILYGRAGLLWALLNFRRLVHDKVGDSGRLEDLHRICGSPIITGLVEDIIRSGKDGARLYEEEFGEPGLSLMWEWHGKYYLGAIHGATGILAILLQAPKSILKPHIETILQTIDQLRELVESKNGFLPSSLPHRHKHHQLVQICHGAPGYLLLLSSLRTLHPEHWKDSFYPSSINKHIWEQGLLTKGLGLCHGISGNAYPWLLLSTLNQAGNEHDEQALAYGTAFIVHSEKCPPMFAKTPYEYRMPDHPLSLFEGLAGAMCAWSDACAALHNQLEPKEQVPILGFPGIGGVGAIGML